MAELQKVHRVAAKNVAGAPHETLLILDATTGQNALSQVKLFNEAIDLTGIVLAKLDGTSKGGVLLAVRDQIDIPVKFVGLGEAVEDLEPFSARDFAALIAGKD